jgi:dTDP-4-amino-4,6-dideoxygalactose transaminase
LTSGRAAITLALEHLGLQPGDDVLIPAFHCESMISPVRILDGNAVFYRISADAKIDIDDLAKKITPSTKAILVTHYFGFLQDLDAVCTLAKNQGISVIEDCAHAFFGSAEGQSVGSKTDYAIGSSMKFYPVYDGGILVSARHKLESLSCSSPAAVFQLKSLLNVLERSQQFSRLGLIGKVLGWILNVKTLLWKAIKPTTLRGQEVNAPASSDGGYSIDINWIHVRASYFTRFITRFSDAGRLCFKRRSNYLLLHDRLKSLTGVRPLYAELPDGVVPLVYPLFFEQPDKHFDALKKLGVPIWRFGEYLDASVNEDLCLNSIRLSKHVFQFPCHQELKPEELEWMICQIETQLSDTGTESS